MALIECPECGKMFSEYAERCPQCGTPPTIVQQSKLSLEDEVSDCKESKKASYNLFSKKSTWGKLIGILFIALLGTGAYFLICNVNRETIESSNLTEEESLEAIKSLAKNIGKYSEIHNFHNGLAMVVRNGKYGFIDIKGNEVIPCKYDCLQSFSEGLSAVFKDGLMGFMNANGDIVIPCIYEGLANTKFSEGLASVCVNEKWGCINSKGEIVIPFEYENFLEFHDGLARINDYDNNNESRFIDKEGKIVLRTRESIRDFHEGLAIIERNGLYGYVNKKMELVLPCQYEEATDFNEGLAAVRLSNSNDWGYIDKEGNQVLPSIYGDCEEDEYGYAIPSGMFSEGLAHVCIQRKWDDYRKNQGFIDRNGNTIIPMRFDAASDFSEGFARVMIEGDGVEEIDWKWGFVDKYGNCTFDYQ